MADLKKLKIFAVLTVLMSIIAAVHSQSLAATTSLYTHLLPALAVRIASFAYAAGGAVIGGVITAVGGAIGGAMIGGALVGTALVGVIYGVATYDGNVAVAVDTSGITSTNPDLAGTTSPLTSSTVQIYGVVGAGGLFGLVQANGGSCGAGCIGTTGTLAGFEQFKTVVESAGGVFSDDFVWTTPTSSGSVFSTSCPGVSVSAFGGTSCTTINHTGKITMPPGTGFGVVPSANGSVLVFGSARSYLTSCPSGSTYRDGSCFTDASASLMDGICKVSYDKAATRYRVNPWDTDCTKVKLQTTAPTSTTPASVAFQSATGRDIKVSTATNASQGIAGGAGAIQVVENVADYSNSTTTTRTTTTTPPSITLPPLVSGGSVVTYPGTGTKKETTPVSTVNIGNWPGVINVSIENPTCPNCCGINDKVKIDGEEPTGSPTDLPDYKDTTVITFGTLVEPLKTKIQQWTNVSVAPHSATCPRLNFGTVNLMNKTVVLEGNGFCEMFEPIKPAISAMMTTMATIVAIMIILST